MSKKTDAQAKEIMRRFAKYGCKESDKMTMYEAILKVCDIADGFSDELAAKDKEIDAQKIEIVMLWAALHEVIDFTPNDTDYPEKPTRDECLDEIKYFAKAALEAAERE